ncbi:MAG: hypothetical protein K2M56_06295 [Muribaculaceae bacterium]|nr:hypothetical protein [Muribaculaceae bacterium]
MKKINIDGREIMIPECIGELTPGQYARYVFLTSHLLTGGLDNERFRIRWLSYLAGLPVDFDSYRDPIASDLAHELHVTDGFFRPSEQDGAIILRPDYDCERNLLPEYEGLRGPGDWLDGLPFGEFTECLTMLESLAAPDIDAEEVAEIYERVTRILYHIPEEREVPDILLIHAPRFFIGIWQRIQSGPIELNGQPIDLRIIFRADGDRRADDKTGWTGLSFEVAQAGLFGRLPEVEQTDFWQILIYLYRCKFEYLESKRKKI